MHYAAIQAGAWQEELQEQAAGAQRDSQSAREEAGHSLSRGDHRAEAAADQGLYDHALRHRDYVNWSIAAVTLLRLHIHIPCNEYS